MGLPATEGLFAEYEEYGVEDCRITPIEGTYLLTYSAYSSHGVRIALARTRDFEEIERIALISQADMRNLSNVVFTCGAIPEDDGTVKIYWGGADSVMCLGTAKIQDLVDLCLKSPRPPMGLG